MFVDLRRRERLAICIRLMPCLTRHQSPTVSCPGACRRQHPLSAAPWQKSGKDNNMKIIDVRVDVLKTPVANAYAAAGRVVDANWQILARVTTEDGVEGFGYIVQPRGDLIPAIACAARELAAGLIGRRVDEPEAAWNALAARADWVGPGGLLHWALAPLDIALWDAAGKSVGQPLFRMLGGARNTVAAYASDNLWYSLSLEALAESVKAHVANGFSGVKLRLSHSAPAHEQAQRVAVAHEAGGGNCRIMVDATQGWDEVFALRAGRAIEAAGGVWLEDPLHHSDLAGLARLRGRLDMPVTGGEHYYTLAQVRECLQAQALDVLILDLARVGGITPWRKIAALAEAFGVRVCGHVVPEVHAHLLASSAAGAEVEYMPRSEAMLSAMPQVRGGVIELGETPGHGLILDEDAVQRYRVEIDADLGKDAAAR
jgi:L-alanine-DL-glutamate epimerase-like enolase superfamily enzyme